MTRWWIVSVCLALACDQDPFHGREHRVLDGYHLQQWEDSESYYLIKDGASDDNGGGVLDGTVQRIGWNDRYILAERKPTFGGDKSGWMIIDAEMGTILGPFSNDELKSRPEVAGIATTSSAQAWSRTQ